MNTKLQAAIASLSAEEQERLLKHLLPVIEARTALFTLHQRQTAESMSEQELLSKRSPYVGKKDVPSKQKLQKIDAELADVRKKIGNHVQERIGAHDKFRTVKNRFAEHY